MAKHPWPGNIRFCGADYSAGTTPWYYLAVWIGITTPLPILLLLFAGSTCVLRKYFSKPAKFFRKPLTLMLLLFFLMFWGELLLQPFTVKHLYNGWRHFYFCYAGVLVMMTYGMQYLWSKLSTKVWGKRIFVTILTVCLGTTAIGMFVNHPHQSSYYNMLASKNTMETDYWNTSGEAALKKLIACEQRNKDLPLAVGCYFFAIQNARFKLSEDDRAVLTTTTKKDSPYLYYIENYVQVYNIPVPEGYHVLFEVESYGRLVGTMYEKDV
jgi:hypothetical protein